jgi:hypothetical protein
MITGWGNMCLSLSFKSIFDMLRKILTRLRQVIMMLMSAEGITSLHCFLILGKISSMT